MECSLPDSRVECLNGSRPCSLVSCSHHFFWLGVDEQNPREYARTILSKFTDKEIIQQFIVDPPWTCFLDWFDARLEEPGTLQEIANLGGFSKERTRQVQARALAKIRRYPRIRQFIHEYEDHFKEGSEWEPTKVHTKCRTFLR